MKKLQSNFTTPEQSKRLLELGVPEWTADCFRWDFGSAFGVSEGQRYSTDISVICFEYQRCFNDKFPCWSVGRLIEILKECTNKEDDLIDIFVELQYSNDILTTILMIFRDNKAILDFSKLEE